MNVNLLPNKSRLEFRKLRIISTIKKSSYFVVAIFLLILLITFIANIYYSRRLKNSQRELSSAQNQYSQFIDEIDELQALRFRVKKVVEVLDKRYTVSDKLENIKDIIGLQTAITKMEIDGKKGELTAIADDYQSLSSIEERLSRQSNDEDSPFSKISFKNLGQQEDGSWLFSAEFIFDNEI